MPKRITWKTAQGRAAVQLIAADVAEFFAIAAPHVFQQPYRTGAEWQWQFETVEVWTRAGRAELNVDVSARFAHMYFRFDNPARAAEPFEMSHHSQRLNRNSGKWNAIATPDSWAQNGKPCPQTALEMFRAELSRDFSRVAEPNPPADEVAAYRAKEAEAATRWAAYMAELEAQKIA